MKHMLIMRAGPVGGGSGAGRAGAGRRVDIGVRRMAGRGVVVERGTHTQLVADERSHYATFMKAQLVSPDAPMSAPGTRLVSLAAA
jgi:hypothetical protein